MGFNTFFVPLYLFIHIHPDITPTPKCQSQFLEGDGNLILQTCCSNNVCVDPAHGKISDGFWIKSKILLSFVAKYFNCFLFFLNNSWKQD